MKTMTIMGTRPEIIRLSETMKKLDMYTNHIMVHTNQSYDYELSRIFFDELGIRKPDYTLDVKSDTVGEQIGKILTQCEQVMLKEKPDAVLILGDTNSALSCIIAKRLKIVVFHMEAGNRCFDERVPEEINRKIVDHISTVNLCYTEYARRNLLREGLPTESMFVVGSPLVEVYSVSRDNIDKSKILEELKLEKNKYILVSIHREENVTELHKLDNVIQTLYGLCEKYNMPIIFSTHPRTRHNLNILLIGSDERIQFHNPFGMFGYIQLQRNAFCNLSDSGTAHEDAAIFGLPMVIVRESNERPEVYDSGNVIMSGLDSGTILNSVELVRGQMDAGVKFVNPYGYETNYSDKVVRLIMGLGKLVAKKEYYV